MHEGREGVEKWALSGWRINHRGWISTATKQRKRLWDKNTLAHINCYKSWELISETLGLIFQPSCPRACILGGDYAARSRLPFFLLFHCCPFGGHKMTLDRPLEDFRGLWIINAVAVFWNDSTDLLQSRRCWYRAPFEGLYPCRATCSPGRYISVALPELCRTVPDGDMGGGTGVATLPPGGAPPHPPHRFARGAFP